MTAAASDAKLPFVAELGADVLLNRHTTDVTQLRERWDLVLDVRDLLHFDTVRQVLTENGVHVSTARSGPTPPGPCYLGRSGGGQAGTRPG